MLRQRLSGSIFIKLFLAFLMVIIPIYALGLYMYSWGIKTVRGEIANSAAAQGSFFLGGLDDEFNRIKTLL